jgi:hypothetical protein
MGTVFIQAHPLVQYFFSMSVNTVGDGKIPYFGGTNAHGQSITQVAP